MPSKFEPGPGDQFVLVIDSRRFSFRSVPHPAAPACAHVISAGRADVHHVQELSTGSDYALKVFMTRYRGPHVQDVCTRLDAHKRSGGMAVCDRRCLSPGRADDTIAEFPNLAYSVLMPWVKGESWFDVLGKGKAGGIWSEGDAIAFALRLAAVLFRLEKAGMAHGDISSGNVLLDRQTGDLQLVDVEDLYAPGWPRPQAPSPGTAGYRHRNPPADVWSPFADRFSAAMLIAEMLTWCRPDVRTLAQGESYFDQGMIDQSDGAAYRPFRDAAARWAPEAGVLLDRAWTAPSLDACPSFAEWYGALQAVSVARYGISMEPSTRPQPAMVAPVWEARPELPVEPPKIEWEPRPRPPIIPPEWK